MLDYFFLYILLDNQEQKKNQVHKKMCFIARVARKIDKQQICPHLKFFLTPLSKGSGDCYNMYLNPTFHRSQIVILHTRQTFFDFLSIFPIFFLRHYGR